MTLSQKSEEEKEKWRKFVKDDHFFTAENFADLQLKGAIFDTNMDQINLTF